MNPVRNMNRFYVSKEKVKGDKIVISGKESHHILDVMRLEKKDNIVVFDGTGKEYTGFVKEIDRRNKELIIEIVGTKISPTGRLLEITLAQAIPKKDRMDYIVEKAAELGVNRIIPMVTERTIVRLDKVSSKRKVERWQRLAIEAAKQCKRLDIPSIDGRTHFKDVLSQAEYYDLVLLAYIREGTISLKKAINGFKSGKVLLFIGPEGDFTPKEISLAGNGNVKFVSLGRYTLKSDTAALFVLSVLNYELRY